MKKILITMVAIAFSLSAFSETRTSYPLDVVYVSSDRTGPPHITIWCINHKVFVKTAEGDITQSFVWNVPQGSLFPELCVDYEDKKKYSL